MSSASDILLDYVCPGLGVIMASAMFAAPLKELQEAMEKGTLGDLNPTPWAFMTGNCLGWVAYSYITSDLFVLFANAPGLLLSIWLNMGAAKLQYYECISMINFRQRNVGEGEEDSALNGSANVSWADDEGAGSPVPSLMSHEKKVLQISFLWAVVLSIVNLSYMTEEQQEELVGVVVNINLAFFYGAPLSTIATVVRTGSSASIHVKTMIMTIANAAFWLAYGLARRDPYIFIPNGVGFVLGCVQALLSTLFPRKDRAQGIQPVDDSDDLNDHLVDGEDDVALNEEAASPQRDRGDGPEII